MQGTESHGEPGWRERKRVQTHARIQATAIELFLRDGFDAVTMDQVAEAAEVSRRSLFHYFRSKEEIVFSTKAGLGELIAEAVAARPADEPLLAMAENALKDMARHFQGPEPRALARLIARTPALRAGDHAKHEALEQVLADALAARKGLAPDAEPVRVTALVAVAILRHATEQWLESEAAAGPEVWGQRAFEALRQVVGDA
jgi:AcrR family transcriptional regulator